MTNVVARRCVVVITCVAIAPLAIGVNAQAQAVIAIAAIEACSSEANRLVARYNIDGCRVVTTSKVNTGVDGSIGFAARDVNVAAAVAALVVPLIGIIVFIVIV